MIEIDELKYDDITISDKYSFGLDYERCKTGLWGIYNVIRKMRDTTHPAVIRECLCAIGVNAIFESDEKNSLIYSGKTNPKYKRNMPAARYLFELENYGFVINNLMAKSNAPRYKLAMKDIEQFRLSYHASDYSDVVLGLKIFANACMNFTKPNVCFYNSDIRVAFSDAPKLYAPPIDEVFSILPAEQKKAAYAVHNKLDEIGCIRNCEGDAAKYSLTKQIFATIWTGSRLWLLPESEQHQKLVFKFNLRHIGQYVDYLDECTESVQQSILAVGSCGHNRKNERCDNGQKNCDGVVFEYQGKKYKKCTRYFCIFKDLSEQAVLNYIRLMELEEHHRQASNKTASYKKEKEGAKK